MDLCELSHSPPSLFTRYPLSYRETEDVDLYAVAIYIWFVSFRAVTLMRTQNACEVDVIPSCFRKSLNVGMKNDGLLVKEV
jgi:hypothetical protein